MVIRVILMIYATTLYLKKDLIDFYTLMTIHCIQVHTKQVNSMVIKSISAKYILVYFAAYLSFKSCEAYVKKYSACATTLTARKPKWKFHTSLRPLKTKQIIKIKYYSKTNKCEIIYNIQNKCKAIKCFQNKNYPKYCTSQGHIVTSAICP